MQAMEIINRLEKYRLENRISQQVIAKKLRVAFSTVNRWLNGKSTPSKIQTYHIQKLIESKKKKYAKKHY